MIQDYDVSEPLDTDFYRVFADIPEADRAAWRTARQFVEEIWPTVNEAWENAEYPLERVRRMGELGLLNDGVAGEGLRTLSPLAAGLVTMEVSRGDGSLGTIIAIQGGLALRTIALHGSAEQKARWLVPVERAEVLAAFALTEPLHGSDSVALETTAVPDADGWVINGTKKWIGHALGGAVTIVWARVPSDDPEHRGGAVRGFLVPQDTPGYSAEVLTGKMALRSVHQTRVTLENVRVPADAVLPGTQSFADTARVLYATRLGVAWSALGHAVACYEAALNYSQQRVQFGRPLAQSQLVQERLAQMLSDVTSMQLHCRHLAELDSRGELDPVMASMAKYTCTRKARVVASIARDMLGANGVLLENHVIRHLIDMEAVHTYEGTESIQALLIGRRVTGESAFR
ncbi:acyl-CoA dehydrogenase family protein [Microterricola viridarii]|uniref:Glutaryl-CoA dehydrogenase n=1 Tax=Microterricola viridarii TaxID=412690 RepID=A0A1H1QTH4_9MICO|nr:acyl-CoA dehydrogenase family protein [Microterricola viridarii]SDS26771.1 glutaryl-CoA dehydrogenase [Microterricola viridarii]